MDTKNKFRDLLKGVNREASDAESKARNSLAENQRRLDIAKTEYYTKVLQHIFEIFEMDVVATSNAFEYDGRKWCVYGSDYGVINLRVYGWDLTGNKVANFSFRRHWQIAYHIDHIARGKEPAMPTINREDFIRLFVDWLEDDEYSAPKPKGELFD